MKIISQKEFKKWLFEQDDDKEINMSESLGVKNGEITCGCLLVQFGRSNGLDNYRLSCSYSTVSSGFRDLCVESIFGFIDLCIERKIKTFKEAKEVWKQYKTIV